MLGPSSTKLTVLLADDHVAVAQGIRLILESQPDLVVVGTAADGEKALSECARLKPNVIVLDIMLPKLSGIDVAHQIGFTVPQCRVVMFSAFSAPEMVSRALRAGARGYVLKESLASDLIEAIRQAAVGGYFLSASVAHKIVKDYLLASSQHLFTDDERQLLEQVTGTAQESERSAPKREKLRRLILDKVDRADVAEFVRVALRITLPATANT